MDFQGIKRIIKDSDNIVFLGGAGVSTESGIPDFSSPNGLYETENGKYTPEEILSRDFFLNHTKEFYQFYLSKMVYRNATPNKAHNVLAELERLGKIRAVITQNIDGLHQQAGSKNVLELHGSVQRNYCMKCKKFFDLDFIIKHEDDIPLCDKCGGIVKPDVVLYQEGLNNDILAKGEKYIVEADVFIIGGTSLQVFPSASLINYYNGNKMILINKTPTKFDGIANFIIPESIGKVLHALIV